MRDIELRREFEKLRSFVFGMDEKLCVIIDGLKEDIEEIREEIKDINEIIDVQDKINNEVLKALFMLRDVFLEDKPIKSKKKVIKKK